MRRPFVERDATGGSLTFECAVLWYLFLADEADFEGDDELCKEYLKQAESLGRGPVGSIHDKRLEDAIKKYGGRDEQNGRLGD